MSGSSTCRSCGRPIVWAVSPAGNNIPMDPEPCADGNIILVGGMKGELARVIVGKAEHALFADQPKYISHFATCPNAAKHRRSRS